MAVVSAAGLLLGSGGLYRLHPALSLGVTEAEAGLLLPGLLGQDVFNLLVGLPLLLGSPWLARRGALITVPLTMCQRIPRRVVWIVDLALQAVIVGDVLL
jgi:hypothetical protein